MNTIFKILEFDKIRENKLFFIGKIVFSLMIALSFFLNSIEVFGHWHGATSNEAFFINAQPVNILLFFSVGLLTFFVVSIVGYIFGKFENKVFCNNNSRNKLFFFTNFIIILICWLPILLSYVPGGLFDDTMEIIMKFENGEQITNHHPLLFSYTLKVFMDLGKVFGDMNIGFVIFTVIQTIAMISSICYGLTWLYKIGINKIILVFVNAFFAFFYLIPLYAVSIWKDTPFCIALLLFTIAISKIVYSKGELLTKFSGIVEFLALSLLVSFLRNNGIYVVIITTLFMVIVFHKTLREKWLKQFGIILIEIILIVVVQGPVYKAFNLNTEFRESVGIMIQQVCYVIKNDGNIGEEELEFINNIEKIDNIKVRYSPYNVDMIKYYEFNDKFLEENKIKFIEIWFKLFFKNPEMYLKAYLLNTTGFWNLSRSEQFSSKNYVYPVSIAANFYDNIWQANIFEMITGKSLRKYINIDYSIVYSWFGAIILFSLLYTIKFKRYKNILMYVPALATLLTIFIAVPIAFGMRYVFGLALIMPFSLLFPIIEKK